MTAHWGVAGPAAGDRLTRVTAFVIAFRELQNHISSVVNLPFDALESLRLREQLDEIGRDTLVYQRKSPGFHGSI